MFATGDYTCWLFPYPSFQYSAGQILDLFGTAQRYNYSEPPEDPDGQAFLRDWAAVAADLRHAIAAFEIDCQPTHEWP